MGEGGRPGSRRGAPSARGPGGFCGRAGLRLPPPPPPPPAAFFTARRRAERPGVQGRKPPLPLGPPPARAARGAQPTASAEDGGIACVVAGGVCVCGAVGGAGAVVAVRGCRCGGRDRCFPRIPGKSFMQRCLEVGYQPPRPPLPSGVCARLPIVPRRCVLIGGGGGEWGRGRPPCSAPYPSGVVGIAVYRGSLVRPRFSRAAPRRRVSRGAGLSPEPTRHCLPRREPRGKAARVI